MSEPTPSGSVQPDPPPAAPSPSGLSDNIAGAIAYVTFIPAIIFLIVEPYNQKAYVRFHAWQSILLAIAAIVIDAALGILLGLLMFVPFFVHRLFMSLIDLGWLVLWLFCVINAYNGKRFKLPIIGDLAEKQAGV